MKLILTALFPTVFKKEPIQSSLLPVDKVLNVPVGKMYTAKSLLVLSNNHCLANLLINNQVDSWYIYTPHWAIAGGFTNNFCVSKEQLKRIYPYTNDAIINAYLPYLFQAAAEFEINTPARLAAFLAQIGHESGDLHYSEEIASGEAYEGRKDLGNFVKGDGVKFKGRGLIQLTGRNNYAIAGKVLSLPLVENPDLAKQPLNSTRIAAWYWYSRGLNSLADSNAFHEITRRINGGYNGLTDRISRWQRAKLVLGIY